MTEQNYSAEDIKRFDMLMKKYENKKSLKDYVDLYDYLANKETKINKNSERMKNLKAQAQTYMQSLMKRGTSAEVRKDLKENGDVFMEKFAADGYSDTYVKFRDWMKLEQKKADIITIKKDIEKTSEQQKPVKKKGLFRRVMDGIKKDLQMDISYIKTTAGIAAIGAGLGAITAAYIPAVVGMAPLAAAGVGAGAALGICAASAVGIKIGQGAKKGFEKIGRAAQNAARAIKKDLQMDISYTKTAVAVAAIGAGLGAITAAYVPAVVGMAPLAAAGVGAGAALGVCAAAAAGIKIGQGIKNGLEKMGSLFKKKTKVRVQSPKMQNMSNEQKIEYLKHKNDKTEEVNNSQTPKGRKLGKVAFIQRNNTNFYS